MSVKRMEVTYREDTFPKIRRKVLVRGFITAVIALAFCGLYLFAVDWYFSLLPGAIALIFACGDIFGVKAIEEARKSTRIVATDSGLTLHISTNKPLYLSWSQIQIGKVKRVNGQVTSFDIKLFDSPIKTFEFCNELSSFDELWNMVSVQTKV